MLILSHTDVHSYVRKIPELCWKKKYRAKMYVLFVCFKIYVSFIHPNEMYTLSAVMVSGRAQHYFGANKIEKVTTLEVSEVKSNKQSD